MWSVERPRSGLREPLLAFGGATALATGLALLGGAIPFLRRNLQACIAIIFFYTPTVAARLAGRRFDYYDAGLRLSPVRTNLAVLGLAVALTFPAFFAGFFVFYGYVCGAHGGPFASLFGALCGHWRGFGGGAFQLPASFLLLALDQLVVVAIPEEIFFRGYLLVRLERVWKPTRRLWGAPVGKALLVSSALFALGHLAVIPNPQRLAVFFPALLFGWMRARTGSIAAGALYHALCNLLADTLHVSYFG